MNAQDLKKTPKNDKNVRKYDIITIIRKDYVIKSLKYTALNVIYCVTNEDLFDILNTLHASIDHGDRNKMVSEL